MSLLGSVIGAIGGVAGNALGGVASSALGQYYNKKNMADQFNYKMRELREAPTNYRKGLEAAGYNPLLALPNSISSSGVSSSNPSTSMDLVSGAKQGAKLANDIEEAWKDENKQRDANIELTRKEVEKKDAEINAINNTTSVTSAKESRSQVLDWLDRIGDIANPFLWYKLGREKYDDFKKRFPSNKFPSGRVLTPSIPSNNSPNLFLDVMKKIAPLTIGTVSAYGSKKAIDKAIEATKETETNKRQRSGRYRSVNYGGGIPSFHNVFNR